MVEWSLARRLNVHSPPWILFWLSSSVGVSMIGLGIIWPLVPVLASDLGAKGVQIGLVIACFNIARSLSNPVAGRLSDRLGASHLSYPASCSTPWCLSYMQE